MTREEALAELNTFKIGAKSELGENALDMAIKALEQEPCEDAVSRAVVLDMMQMKMGGKELYKAVYDMPSVIPTRCIAAIRFSKEDMQELLNEKMKDIVVERKVGKWIYDKKIQNWRCSECNEIPRTPGYVGTADFMAEHFRFCNHCGVDMRGAEDGSN